MDLSSQRQYIQRAVSVKKDVTSTALTTLYTCPGSTDFDFSIIESILIGDDGNQATTVTLSITDSTGHPFTIFKEINISAKETKELLTRSVILVAGDILKIEVSHANINVVASLIEYAKGD
tara:strand:- start:7564 stop:7926 length:363 start_codon:yes stop_codon:yes gene_type:complete